MKVVVFGSRSWTDWIMIGAVLCRAPVTLVVHGDCKTGADMMAKAWARANGVPETGDRYAARWLDPDGNIDYAAGPARNRRMGQENKDADCALGFRMPGKSRGTDHMLSVCKALQIRGFMFNTAGVACAF